MDLLIGSGSKADRRIVYSRPNWIDLVTLDIDKNKNPDVVHDLTVIPLPFEDNTFDEIHAYQVLEHTGMQGDYNFFFRQFSDFWRILKPNGLFCAMCPSFDSLWAFGDPGHTRMINEGTIVFLSQDHYKKEVGVTCMTDYRHIYKADFEIVYCNRDGSDFVFILKAIK